LTSPKVRLKYRQIPAKSSLRLARAGEVLPGFMNPIPPSPATAKNPDMAPCKHPRVRIVARDEDAEFVECLECSEVFESSEFKDMNIEETKLKNES
jgi:hypothetical protein